MSDMKGGEPPFAMDRADDLARGDNAALVGRFRTLRTFLLLIGGLCLLVSVFIGPRLMQAVGARADAHTVLALLMGTASFALALQIQLMGAFSSAMGGGQVVLRDFATGVNYGASDPRKDGEAVAELPVP